jgi:hypothetical protein
MEATSGPKFEQAANGAPNWRDAVSQQERRAVVNHLVSSVPYFKYGVIDVSVGRAARASKKWHLTLVHLGRLFCLVLPY